MAEEIYVVCLLVGFCLSVVMAVTGSIHAPAGHHVAHGGGQHAAHAGSHTVGHGGTHSGSHTHGTHADAGNPIGHSLVWALSWLSPLTAGGFLLLFGGAGLLGGGSALALPVAIVAGLLGAIAVRSLMAAFVRASTPPLALTAEGAIGTVNATIRSGETGEVVYTLEGLTRSMPARSDESGEIPRGVQVVITRTGGGFAYVEPLERLEEST